MAYYETIIILDSLLTPEEIEKAIDRVKELIEKAGGKILKVDAWGKRRLAYEIKKKQYGYYVCIEFEEKGSVPTILDNEYNYNDKVLRYLTYRFDKKKMDMLEEQNKKDQKRKSTAEHTVKKEESTKDSAYQEREVADEK
jgi:small subunit ribosomal protein S6